MQDLRTSQLCRELFPEASTRPLFPFRHRLRARGVSCFRRAATPEFHPDLRMYSGSEARSGPGETESPRHPDEAALAGRSADATQSCELNREYLSRTAEPRQRPKVLRAPRK